MRVQLFFDELPGRHPVTQYELNEMMKMPYPEPKTIVMGTKLFDAKYDLQGDYDEAVKKMAEDKCSKAFSDARGSHLEKVMRDVIKRNSNLRLLDDPGFGADISFTRKGGALVIADIKNTFTTVNASAAKGVYQNLMNTAAHLKIQGSRIYPALLTNFELNRKSTQNAQGLFFINTADTMCLVGNNYGFADVWLNAVANSGFDKEEYASVLDRTKTRLHLAMRKFKTPDGFNAALAFRSGV